MDIFDYREALTKNIIGTSSIISISELPPEKWILGNYKANEYRTALFKALYLDEEEKRLKLHRITLVDNKRHFDDYIENILLEKVNMHLECYLNNENKKSQLDKLKSTITNEILEDTYAIFSSIHTSISDSYIIWKDEVKLKGKDDILQKCLTFNNKKYHEILIYDDKILFVHHKNIEELEKDTNITLKNVTSTNKIKTYINRWNDLKLASIDNNLGVSLKDYIEQKISKDFWSDYDKFEKLDTTLRDFVIEFFNKTISDNQALVLLKGKKEIKELWEIFYDNDDKLSPILNWSDLENFIDNLTFSQEKANGDFDYMLNCIRSVNPEDLQKKLEEIKLKILNN